MTFPLPRTGKLELHGDAFDDDGGQLGDHGVERQAMLWDVRPALYDDVTHYWWAPALEEVEERYDVVMDGRFSVQLYQINATITQTYCLKDRESRRQVCAITGGGRGAGMAGSAYSFIRSTHPPRKHTAWCLLLERQGHQASSKYHT